MFSFDTLTGEIVNNQLIDPTQLSYIHFLEHFNAVVCVTSKGITIVDVSAGPVITDVEISKRHTIIKGANLLSGARVEVNGEDLGIADRNPDNPGHEIILDRGKKHFLPGQPVNLIVINRDG